MHVELNRQFVKLSKEAISTDDIETQAVLGRRSALSWSDILQKHRVVLLSSAGSGKTEEIRHQCDALRLSGSPAFFLRLEHLAHDWDTAFEIGDHEELDEALAGQSDVWLFLDSIDEARLSSPKDFERAIFRVAAKMRHALQRTHIVLTSRPHAWRADGDARMLENKLPYKASIAAPLTGANKQTREEVEDDIVANLGDDSSDHPTSEKPEVCYVTLQSLSENQVKSFATAHDVQDVEEFQRQISRNDVSSLASRPGDLEDLVSFWKENHRLGCRLELVAANIQRKLEERDPDRAGQDPLSAEKALQGSQRLAAAISLTRQTRIYVPDSSGSGLGLKVQDVLTDWTARECTALLSRPVFDPETYGFVRFHHRDTLEFLAANWFAKILKNGNSRQSIEGLFFANQYGMDVVVPRLRTILPWLALFDENIRTKLAAERPEVLLEGGDPSQLPADLRSKTIRQVCARYAGEETARINVELHSLQRLVQPDMGELFTALFAEYDHIPEINRFLLKGVEAGALSNCADFAISAASSLTQDEYTRVYGMRAIMAIGSQETKEEIVRAIALDGSLKDRRLLGHFLDVFGNDLVASEMLVTLLGNVEVPNDHGYDSLNQSLTQYQMVCPLDDVVCLLRKVEEFLGREPFVKQRHYKISQQNKWMLEFAIGGLERLTSEQDPACLDKDILKLMSLVSQSRHYDMRHDKSTLVDSIRAWRDLNYALFWFDVHDTRQTLDATQEKRLTEWWRARIFRDFTSFDSEDFDVVVQWIGSRSFLDDQLVALSLAFHLYVKADRPASWRKNMKTTVAGNSELEQQLHQYLHPPAQSEEDKKWKRQNAAFERKQKKRVAEEAENHAWWKKNLPNQLAQISNKEPAGEGKIWAARQYLFNRMSELGKDLNRWAQSNWSDLIEDQCTEVAEAMRTGLLSEWRNYRPEIASESGKLSDTTPYQEVYGLSGLEIEASETAGWPGSLSQDEAEQAAAYLFSELNGFPNWFRILHNAFPDVVAARVLAEVQWDLFGNKTEGLRNYVLSDLVWHASWMSDDIAPEIVRMLRTQDPLRAENLASAIKLILSSETVSDQQFADLCVEKMTGEVPDELQPVWLAAWVTAQPKEAIEALQSKLESLDASTATDFAIAFINELCGGRREASISIRDNHKKPHHLKDLYLLMHEHIRREDDLQRAGKGVYSPNSRDDAQDARNSLFSELLEIPGKQAFDALMDVANMYPVEDARTWMRSHAEKRAEIDADLRDWTPQDFTGFAEKLEIEPKTHKQLYDLTVYRLEDLRIELEESDTSPAGLWIKAEDETLLRNQIAGWLRDRSNNNYSVPQEEEMPDAKRPDVRIHNSKVGGAVPIELKIADKGWSGPKLFERLENQLCGDYLRDADSSCGVFLLVYRGTKKRWRHPKDKRDMDFNELRQALQERAIELIQQMHHIENVKVAGINLTKRGSAKKKAKPTKKIG
ncbi:hypothetical protein [uncultured Roseobacter sp.]|uniref:hypothetical protein n=1 Tax=uncultured Roseobacter sp. TaxID=114847 RepID=UPI002637ADE3|nr:hypothetical protein [uncultured Roseobacter sp.]